VLQKMSQKLWVAYKTPAQTFIDKVSIESCDDIADLLKEIKKEFALSVPPSQLTLYKSDGTTEIDVGDSPSDCLNGNSRNNPLIVKTHSPIPALKSVTTEKATFQLYSWRASKKPFKVILLDLNEGRIPLKALLEKEKMTSLYRMDAEGNVILLADQDGFSIQKWINGQTYKLRVKTSTSVDIEIPFSEKDQEKMNIITVRDDFGIQFEESPWLFSGDSSGFPFALTQTLALYAQFKLESNASVRDIPSVHCFFISSLRNFYNSRGKKQALYR
jgi:hypothetical protein